ncbi:DNA protecting protein DprA [Candidatus Epulonipiscioides gigas]|nr:DNA protecting protein DprA [Epulopiscium sp. SCG-C07WGA-EpuloA2]
MDEDVYSIWLNSVGISSNIKVKMLEAAGSFKEVYYINEKRCKDFDLKKEQIEKFITAKEDIEKSYKILEYSKQNGIDIINIAQKNYPEALSHINEPPIVLYGKGNKEALSEISIAIVGSRNCSDYGFQMATKFARELAEVGVCVISGLATGIDSCAHRGSLAVPNKTLAVLGTGVDICYPKTNMSLYNKIIDNGYIISEYAPETKPITYHFPQRNRIISGLSLGVLVVEAAQKSGSLITATHALNQGKLTFAIPSNLGSKFGEGSNEFIKDGCAKLIQNIQDIIEEFSLHIKVKLKQNMNEKNNNKKNLLDKNETLVYDCFDTNPISYNEILEKTRLENSTLDSILLRLSLNNIIFRIPGNRYLKNK